MDKQGPEGTSTEQLLKIIEEQKQNLKEKDAQIEKEKQDQRQKLKEKNAEIEKAKRASARAEMQKTIQASKIKEKDAEIKKHEFDRFLRSGRRWATLDNLE